MGITLLQEEPSANAPCTKTMVGFGFVEDSTLLYRFSGIQAMEKKLIINKAIIAKLLESLYIFMISDFKNYI
jgi:hypothetical protein